MPPKLTDDTPLTFLEHNPKRAGSKAHERFQCYKVAKTVAEALRLGASRSDITSDIKAGFCTSGALPPKEAQKRPLDSGPLPKAKVQREDSGRPPVSIPEPSLPEPSQKPPEASSSSMPREQDASKQPLQQVDLSFANMSGKPMRYVKRTMGEAKRLLSPEGLAEAEKSGYRFCLKDKENLARWFVQLRDINPDGKLAADLKKHNLDASIDLELVLPDGFPMEPPFVRVVYPQLKGGFVFERGGICFEPLTQKGWAPSMTLPTLAIAIKGILDYGDVRIAGVGDRANRTVAHYTEEGARKDHTAISAAHRGGDSNTYGKNYTS
ncbi:Ubiquitin-conjugating enzyme E2Q-like protein [Symbiodinium microadriaticum]|uniref:Ubiquitin-conjugating enzyme E2Q-like protein n=1 Tax=Symbiodinium microadriaticum TaxID=2951 RepID=A0A1Q9CSK9_SYMMI|nr:Ubiquitin-conjugating enzyme E2Q-like protein [Symbiodinium microadriaticum]CAE7873611.1 ubc-25 [Symbiodinium microadriaticum]CAE7947928.1 ubc-25 [Symbiodinium sp. KB8]